MTPPGPLQDELILRARMLSGVLASRGIDHAFIGGLAMNVWTIPQPTFDIDLCASLAGEDVPALLPFLEKEGFIPPPTPWLEKVGKTEFLEFTLQWPFDRGLRPAACSR